MNAHEYMRKWILESNGDIRARWGNPEILIDAYIEFAVNLAKNLDKRKFGDLHIALSDPFPAFSAIMKKNEDAKIIYDQKVLPALRELERWAAQGYPKTAHARAFVKYHAGSLILALQEFKDALPFSVQATPRSRSFS